MKVHVHTIRTGYVWWLDQCAPTLDVWCEKHGHTLTIWDEKRIPKNYPDPKFCEIDMLREFLTSDAEVFFYIDADVYIDPKAPALPAEFTGGLMAMSDPPGGVRRAWPRWLMLRHPGALSKFKRWDYRNAGIWLCDRVAAATILNRAVPPHYAGCMEQHAWNLWCARAAKDGMPVHHLPQEWNRFTHWPAPAHFYHIAGKNKEAKWQKQIERGNIILPEPQTI